MTRSCVTDVAHILRMWAERSHATRPDVVTWGSLNDTERVLSAIAAEIDARFGATQTGAGETVQLHQVVADAASSSCPVFEWPEQWLVDLDARANAGDDSWVRHWWEAFFVWTSRGRVPDIRPLIEDLRALVPDGTWSAGHYSSAVSHVPVRIMMITPNVPDDIEHRVLYRLRLSGDGVACVSLFADDRQITFATYPLGPGVHIVECTHALNRSGPMTIDLRLSSEVPGQLITIDGGLLALNARHSPTTSTT
jgi:hypothetical protein